MMECNAGRSREQHGPIQNVIMKVVVALWCVVLWSASGLFAEGIRWQPQQGAIKGIVIPIYPDKGACAAGSLRIGRVYSSHARLGFFRIGLLPVVMLDTVRLEVKEEGAWADLLGRACERMEGLAVGRACELKHFEVVFPHESKPRLKAAAAQWDARQRVLLLTRVCVRQGDREIVLSKARLDATGRLASDAGPEGGAWGLQLFQSNGSSTSTSNIQ